MMRFMLCSDDQPAAQGWKDPLLALRASVTFFGLLVDYPPRNALSNNLRFPLDIQQTFWHRAALACTNTNHASRAASAADESKRGSCMRRGTVALTLAFGLGVCGMLSAEESGNWFTRLFTRSSDKDAPTKSSAAKDGTPTLNPMLPNVPLIRAQANLQRRQAACLRLREIAIATNDDDLLHKAALLDDRAWQICQRTRERAREAQQPIGEANLKDAKAGPRPGKGGIF
jgi:hypothetical protein